MKTACEISAFVALWLSLGTSVVAQELDSLLRTAEAHQHDSQFQGALSAYLNAHALDASHCETLWQIAKVHVDLGEEADEVTRKQHYYIAEKWARKALSACPDNPNAHFLVAVSSGLLALYEGGKRKIARSKEVKLEADRTLQLDAMHHGAYHVLGRWHRELANLNWFLKAVARIVYGGVPPGASNETAVLSFKKAISIRPDWIEHYKELASTYMAMRRWQEATTVLDRCISLKVIDHQDDEHQLACLEMLQQLEQ